MRGPGTVPVYVTQSFTVYTDSLVDRVTGLTLRYAEPVAASDSATAVLFGIPVADRTMSACLNADIQLPDDGRELLYAMTVPFVAKDSFTVALRRYSGWPVMPGPQLEHQLGRLEAALIRGAVVNTDSVLLLLNRLETVNGNPSDSTVLLGGAILPPEQWTACYPAWFEMRDAYDTGSLYVNVLRGALLSAVRSVRQQTGDSIMGLSDACYGVANAVNDALWIPNRGYYAAYEYCRPWSIKTHMTDQYAQAMAMLYGIATQPMAQSITRRTPVTDTGVNRWMPGPPGSADSPDLPSMALLGIAAAREGDVNLLQSMFWSTVRLCGLEGVTDSWPGRSVASVSMLGLALRGIAGLQVGPGALTITPCIPPSMPDGLEIRNLRYAGSVLDLTVKGCGSQVTTFTVDGVAVPSCTFSAYLTGRHKIVVTMDGYDGEQLTTPSRPVPVMPDYPVVDWLTPRRAKIAAPELAPGHTVDYCIYLDGVFIEQRMAGNYNLYDADRLTAVEIVPVADNEVVGLCNRPHLYIPDGCRLFHYPDRAAEAAKSRRYRYKRPRKHEPLPSMAQPVVTCEIDVLQDGDYLMRAAYSQDAGAAPDSIAAAGPHIVLRRVEVNGEPVGSVAAAVNTADRIRCVDPSLPPGLDATNFVTVHLRKGRNTVTLLEVADTDRQTRFDPYAMLNCLIFYKQ